MTQNPDLIKAVMQVRMIAFDFDGVFTDNTVYTFEDGREAVRCWRSDGIGLANLSRLGIDLLVISKEVNPVVSARCRKIELPCIQGCDDKRGALEQVLKEEKSSLQETAFMGNDTNDIPCLEIVGFPIVVCDAHPDVLGLERYRTRTRGGFGAVREVCDLFEEVLTHNTKAGGRDR